MTEPRFTVHWFRGRGASFALAPGFAVFDHCTRITITWPSFAEACQHRDRIAQIYAENGW